MSASEIWARERPWFVKVGAAGVAGGILAMLGFILLQAAIGGGANFESLEDANDNSAGVWLAGIATCLGYLLLTAPFYFLFRAARDRSDRVKGQIVGLVVLGPVLLAISAPVISAGTQDAANRYLGGDVGSTLSAGEAKEECVEEREEEGAEQFDEDFEASGGKSALAVCEEEKTNEDIASESIKETGLLTVGQFVGLAGTFALLFSLLYTGLWSMRTGLLTRFWGSLGMAVGVASLIGFSPITFIWFIYLGLLLSGAVPGGRPPAWEAGKAIPWPTPGEKAAAEMSPGPDEDATIDVDATEIDPDDGSRGNGGGGPRRKRKRRE